MKTPENKPPVKSEPKQEHPDLTSYLRATEPDQVSANIVESYLPEGVRLRELDLSFPATKARIKELWPKLDQYTRDVLYYTWQDADSQVCLQCGHVIIADTGECSANKEHRHRKHKNTYAATRVVFQ